MIRLNIRDTFLRLIELDCASNWKLLILINEYKVKHKAEFGKIAKKNYIIHI